MKKADFYEINYWQSGITTEELPIYSFCSEYSLRSTPHKMNMTKFPFLLFCGIKEGALQFIFRKQKILLQEQDVLLIPPGTPFSFESYSTGGHYAKLVLELKGTLLTDYLNSLHLNTVCFWQHELWQDFFPAFSKIHEFNRQQKTESIPDMTAIVIRLLHLCTLHNNTREDQTDPNLAAACRWIEEHLNSPLNLAVLEKQLGICHSSLGRLFRNGTGMSPRAYWIQRRLEAAKFLLLNSNLSIKEISYRLGYSSQFHFSNEFSRLNGLSPRQFRQRGFV